MATLAATRFAPARHACRIVSDWLDLQEWLLTRSLREVAPRAGGRLLDIGCGAKPHERLFRPHVREYLGVECAATFGRTRAALGEHGPDLLYDGLHLPFGDRSFDTVLAIEVLEHTPRPAELVSEMARVLGEGSLLILVAPFSLRLHEEPHDYFRYTPYGLAELCSRAGLRVLAIEPHGGLWSVLAHKLNCYLAFRVLRILAVAQALGKAGHEPAAEQRARLWALPLVAPLMAAAGAAGRLLDRALPDSSEALSFLILAVK